MADAVTNNSTASWFKIAELTGKGRILILQERALPFRGYELSGTMRAETTWYPGNPIASVQVLGAAEDPTTITGVWKDRFLKATDEDGKKVEPQAAAIWYDGGRLALESAFDVAQKMDSLRRSGQVVEVTWDEMVRRGIISQFKQKWPRREICEWEVKFDWISQGEDEVPVGIANEPAKAAATSSMSKSMSTAQDSLMSLTDFMDQVDEYMAQVADGLGQLNALSTQASSMAEDPESAALASRSSCTAVKKNCALIMAQTEAQPAREVAPSAAVAGSDGVTMGAALAAGVSLREVRDAMREMRAEASTFLAQLEDRTTNQELLGVFNARDGMDLRDVATQFYGTPEEWKRLLTYNGFTSSELTAGDVVFIPKLRTVGG